VATELVVRAGCDVSIRDWNGHTGRKLAELKGHTAVVVGLYPIVTLEKTATEYDRKPGVKWAELYCKVTIGCNPRWWSGCGLWRSGM
jgi:hypothetical protein